MSFTGLRQSGFSLESSTKVVAIGFVHLHVHSQYSFLDGASSLDKLLNRAVGLGMPALALTDHNRLTGAIRFYEKAKALGIKPIIGAEIDLEGEAVFSLLSAIELLSKSAFKPANGRNPPLCSEDFMGCT